MKRIIMCLLICLTFLSFGAICFASENIDSVDNLEMSEEEAKEIFGHSSYTGTDENGVFYFKSNYNPNEFMTRSVSKEVASTTFAIVPEDQTDAQEWSDLVSRRASYNSYGEQWDGSKSVKIFSTVYYTINGTDAKLVKVTGGYTKSDHSVSVISQSITYACNHFGNNQYATSSQGSKTSWTIYPPSSWTSINIDAGTCMIGANSTVQVKRSASPWTIELSNNPVRT